MLGLMILYDILINQINIVQFLNFMVHIFAIFFITINMKKNICITNIG